MSVVSFFLLLLGLLLLPFVPGIMEIRRKLDAQPLRVTRAYDVDIHHFANRFRQYIQTHFAQDLADVPLPELKEGGLEDGSRYCLLGAQAAVSFEEAERNTQVTNRLFIAAQDLALPGAMTYLNELYANGAIQGADEDIYRAMLAGADIDLGRDSVLLRWMHASGEIRAATGCVLYGRVSADQRIVMASRSRFRRLNARAIQFGTNVPVTQTAQARQEIKPEDLNVSVEVAAGRWLIEDDLSLADNSCVHADLVVVGSLTLGKNCEIHGSIKSHKSLHIQAGCAIHGSVVCMQDIRIEACTRLKGPLVSEARIDLAANCEIGSTVLPTTITADEIHIQPDCLAHGTVWARSLGKVNE
jgi:predicted acyltransferase (DUF342 family)